MAGWKMMIGSLQSSLQSKPTHTSRLGVEPFLITKSSVFGILTVFGWCFDILLHIRVAMVFPL